jgi:hypothetical protein
MIDRLCPLRKAAKCDWCRVGWARLLFVNLDVVLNSVDISDQASGYRYPDEY